MTTAASSDETGRGRATSASKLDCADDEPHALGVRDFSTTSHGSTSANNALRTFVKERWPQLEERSFEGREHDAAAVYVYRQDGALQAAVRTQRFAGGWNVTHWTACNGVLVAAAAERRQP